jgi:hypothetical protein
MKSKDVLYNKIGGDESYTFEYGVEPILKYIPKHYTVWCPFDKEDSNFVKLISRTNKVIYSHIDYGQDFFNYEPQEHWDCIVSNPPFKNKRLFFERALSFNKPFALLNSLTWLNDSAPKKLFEEKQLQLLMFDKRMEFFGPDVKEGNKITFSSAYYCYNFLPEQIIIEKLNK